MSSVFLLDKINSKKILRQHNNYCEVITQRVINRYPLHYYLSKYFLIIVIRISRRKPKKSKGQSSLFFSK